MRRALGWIALVGIAPLAVFYGIRDTADLDTVAMWIFYIFLSAALPFMFELTKDWWLDRQIGDLSYALYIVHPLTIAAFRFYFGADMPWLVVLTVVSLAAAFIRYCLEVPIDHIRSRLRGTAPTTRGASKMPVAILRLDDVNLRAAVNVTGSPRSTRWPL